MNAGGFIDVTLLATTFTTLFVVMDPVGTVPVFLALTGGYAREDQRKAAAQATLTSLAVILVFAVLGKYILRFLQISMEALQLSGGFLLFLVSMELLMGRDDGPAEGGAASSNVALVPLGTPLLAGPGAIVTVMVGVDQGGGHLAGWVAVAVAILLMHVVMYLTMRFAVAISGFLGESGITLLTRISGLLLAAIATQMMAQAGFAFVKHFRSLGYF